MAAISIVVLVLLCIIPYFASDDSHTYLHPKSRRRTQDESCPDIVPHTFGTFLNLKVEQIEGNEVSRFSLLSQSNLMHAADLYYGGTGSAFRYWKDKMLVNDRNLLALKATGKLGCLRDGVVIYVEMILLKSFFSYLYPDLKAKFVLVTGGQVDDSVPFFYHLEKYILPENNESLVIHWYGQNCDTDGGFTGRFTCIPEGMHDNTYWYPQPHHLSSVEISAKHSGHLIATNPINLDRLPAMRQERVNTTYDLLVPFMNLGTHDERINAVKLFCDRTDLDMHYEFLHSNAIGGIISRCLPMLEIPVLNEVYAETKFIVCPHGKGTDTHRFWEVLHMGAYPVVTHSNLDPMFADLPVVIVNAWEDVTKELLDRKYAEFSTKNWSLDVLKPTYWEKRFSSHGYPRYDYSGMFLALNISAKASALTLERIQRHSGDVVTVDRVSGYYHINDNRVREIVSGEIFYKYNWNFKKVNIMTQEDLSTLTVGEDLCE